MFQDFNMDVSNLSRSRWVVVTYIFDKKSLMLVISLYMSIPLNLTFIYCQLKFRINEKRLNETHGNIRFSVYLSNWMKSKWCCIKFNIFILFLFDYFDATAFLYNTIYFQWRDAHKGLLSKYSKILKSLII